MHNALFQIHSGPFTKVTDAMDCLHPFYDWTCQTTYTFSEKSFFFTQKTLLGLLYIGSRLGTPGGHARMHRRTRSEPKPSRTLLVNHLTSHFSSRSRLLINVYNYSCGGVVDNDGGTSMT